MWDVYSPKFLNSSLTSFSFWIKRFLNRHQCPNFIYLQPDALRCRSRKCKTHGEHRKDGLLSRRIHWAIAAPLKWMNECLMHESYECSLQLLLLIRDLLDRLVVLFVSFPESNNKFLSKNESHLRIREKALTASTQNNGRLPILCLFLTRIFCSVQSLFILYRKNLFLENESTFDVVVVYLGQSDTHFRDSWCFR